MNNLLPINSVIQMKWISSWKRQLIKSIQKEIENFNNSMAIKELESSVKKYFSQKDL